VGRAKRKPKPRDEEPLVNPFAERHGDYGHRTISITAGELDGEGHGQKQVTVNRGGSALQRWINSEAFTQSQLSAINLYSRAWHRVFSEPRVTANLSPIAFIRTTGDEADRNAAKVDAMELLKFLDGRIFDIAPPHYRDTWQDVVIYSRDNLPDNGNARTRAKERSLTICLFIADMIATVMRL